MDNKEQLSAVTKEKHPGRVAQGHKLAALMKKRKEELKSEQQTEQSTEQLTEPTSATSNTTLYSIILVAGIAGIAALFYWKRNAVHAVKPKDDIFRMN